MQAHVEATVRGDILGHCALAPAEPGLQRIAEIGAELRLHMRTAEIGP
jgi:hypothetical protein